MHLSLETKRFVYLPIISDVPFVIDPVKIDTSMQICCLAWNSNGSILAVGGSQQSASQVDFTLEICSTVYYNLICPHVLECLST